MYILRKLFYFILASLSISLFLSMLENLQDLKHVTNNTNYFVSNLMIVMTLIVGIFAIVKLCTSSVEDKAIEGAIIERVEK